MNARNRMAEVVKLRCNACQDFLKMVIVPDWQSRLYASAQLGIQTPHLKDKYTPIYEKMRDNGVENYRIEDMDVTTISLILSHCQDIAPVKKETRNAMRQLREDRNQTVHSSENEPPEELYLRGLLALCNLREFVRTVDQFEITIDDQLRLAYRQKYIKAIEELKSILDDERIELIQKEKNIDKDIEKILSSNDPSKAYREVSDVYDKLSQINHNREELYRFEIRASDAGIKYAHAPASFYFIYLKKDFAEAERRMLMLLQSYEHLPAAESKGIIASINACLVQGHHITSSIKHLILEIEKQGYSVIPTDDGLFEWKNARPMCNKNHT